MEPEETLADQVAQGAARVLRGLPRLYSWKDPALSKIKPGFDDLKLVRERHMEKVALRAYAGRTPPEKSRILLFSWIMEDGWGDYYVQLHAGEILRRAFPTSEITLISALHEGKEAPKKEEGCAHYTLSYRRKSRKEILYQPLSEEMLAALRSASLFLQLPTYFPHTEEILACAGRPLTHLLIGECGFIDTPWFHPKSGAHCMGLHFLEKGVLIRTLPRCPVKPCFNLDYSKTDRGSYLFLHTLLKALEEDPRDITIAVSRISLYVEQIEGTVKPLLKRLGIGRADIHFQGSVCSLPINEKGKRLTISHFDHLPHAHFLEMVAQTDQLIGCTGDSSLMEALSSGKPFFYEAPRHKRSLLKDLIALAQEQLGKTHETTTFLRLSLINPHLPMEYMIDGWVTEEFLLLEREKSSPEDTRDETLAERMGELLRSQRLIEGFKELSQLIRREYAFNETLCQLVVRSLESNSLTASRVLSLRSPSKQP